MARDQALSSCASLSRTGPPQSPTRAKAAGQAMTDPTGVTLDDEPRPLRWLTRRLTALSDRLIAVLGETGDVDAWQEAYGSLLTRYHAAAMLTGYAGKDAAKALELAKAAAGRQLAFLAKFARVAEDEGFKPGYEARARMYAESIGESYYRGVTQLLPLPAVPRDGSSQCRTNCKCRWELDELAGDGNVDAYWRLGASENCQTCTVRARRWAPLKIRGGELV